MSYGNNTFQVCKKKSGGKGKSKGKKKSKQPKNLCSELKNLYKAPCSRRMKEAALSAQMEAS